MNRPAVLARATEVLDNLHADPEATDREIAIVVVLRQLLAVADETVKLTLTADERAARDEARRIAALQPVHRGDFRDGRPIRRDADGLAAGVTPYRPEPALRG